MGMKRGNRLITRSFIAFTVAMGLSTFSKADPLDFPSGSAPKNGVPIGLLKKIALNIGEHISGTRLVAGKPISYCNLDGDIIAYEFPFCQSCSAFPSDDEIIAGIKVARDQSRNPKAGRERRKQAGKEVWGVGKFWSVTLSSTEDRYPLLEVSEGLPRFYTVGDLALEPAKKILKGGAVKLSRIYYASPLDQFFEYTDGNDVILASPFTFATSSKDKIKEVPGKVGNEEGRHIKAEWGRLRKKVV